MKILIADDDPMYRHLLQAAIAQWGYDSVLATTGDEAWEALQQPKPPLLAILDWMMPGLSGLEVCRRVQALAVPRPTYLILLTAREATEDIVAGLEAGANDYITKPFDQEELRARVQVGRRVVELEEALALRVRELEEALTQVKQLRGLLPICSYCKKVRDDKNYWHQVESYVTQHSEASFSHGICPECWKTQVEPELERLETRLPKPPV